MKVTPKNVPAVTSKPTMKVVPKAGAGTWWERVTRAEGVKLSVLDAYGAGWVSDMLARMTRPEGGYTLHDARWRLAAAATCLACRDPLDSTSDVEYARRCTLMRTLCESCRADPATTVPPMSDELKRISLMPPHRDPHGEPVKKIPKKPLAKILKFPGPGKAGVSIPREGEWTRPVPIPKAQPKQVASAIQLGKHTHVVTWGKSHWPAHEHPKHPGALLVDLRTCPRDSDTLAYDDDYCAEVGVPEQVRWDAAASQPPGFAFVPASGSSPSVPPS